MITYVTVYKAIKQYKGDDLITDLSYCIALNDIDLLTKDEMENAFFKKENAVRGKNRALKYLRVLKLMEFKKRIKMKDGEY